MSSRCKSTSTLYLIYLISNSPINISEPLTVPQDLHKDPRTLCCPSSQLHHPCAYRERCGLDNMLPFLFIYRLYGPGTTWSTKPIQVILLYFLNQVTIFPQDCTLYLLLPRPQHSLTMNSNKDTVFNTVLHNIRESIPFITAYVFFDPEKVHL